MIKYLIISIFTLFAYLGSQYSTESLKLETVASIEEKLGKSFADRKPDFSIPGTSADAGRAIVHDGFGTNGKGKKTRIQSKHFVCTSCHNTVKEDPNLASIDAQSRLDYAADNGLPYLQGSPLYGAINRKTFYNGDYYLKYGDLVKPAKYDIRKAIQLCATECAQGRELADWEVESVLAYLWEIGLKIEDLNLAPQEQNQLISTLDGKVTKDASDLIEVLERQYPTDSPATFVAPPSDRKAGNGLTGDPANGLKVYETSCLHCHSKGRYSYLHLEKDNMSVSHLRRKAKKYHRHSIYQVTRWGVPVMNGKPSYMPQYTLEKMTEQQLSDLLAFVEVGY